MPEHPRRRTAFTQAPTYGAVWLAFFALAGCGGSFADPAPDGGARKDSGRNGDGPPGTDGRSSSDAYPVFREDACSDAPVVQPPLECDPFAQTATCRRGDACYPIPPRGTDLCHPGSYSTACLPEGTGKQGTACDDTTDCAGGFVCVASGFGNLCHQLCRTSDLDACADGRVCREIDVTGSGWGACE